ncbi:MAG: M28 family peptidase, partial [Bacteroidales bacterium]|nr:M28 family peptidase [Bacteroidales bacterium]
MRLKHPLLILPFLILGCGSQKQVPETALESITADDMKKHISVLASDEFQGRFPGTEGEDKTVNYLTEQFRLIGLKPANGDSFSQEVPLLRLTSDPDKSLLIKGGKTALTLSSPVDFVGWSSQTSELINIEESELVFIGYGINAPEFGWNDYEGIDVKGKTVLMLVNDPGYATSDTSLFNGRAMTIYGRWTYKFEEAARQGAKAAIIIHETGAASYPWSVVVNSWSGSNYSLAVNGIAESDLQMQGWITTDYAVKIFESAGLDYNKMIASAATGGFRPVSMNLKASVSFSNKAINILSNNVAGVLPGNKRSDEYIIYTAHWDHFGVNPSLEGDSIFNGALDNATGTAALFELAEAFVNLPERQDRSILFLAVTGEEQGLLGSRFYVSDPLVPLNKTVGVINMDALNITGKTRDMAMIGLGISGLDDYMIQVLEKYGRYATPDPFPEQGGFFRSDHFSFAEAGVPVLYPSSGVDDVKRGIEWGKAESDRYIA